MKLMVSLLLMLPVAASRAAVPNPDTFVQLSGGEIVTLDPSSAGDSASQAVLFNVYETLFQFEGSSLVKMIPLLAEKVPSAANGLISPDGRTYTIPIRKGVRFHDGTLLTAEDVRYSFLRSMLQDRAGGPTTALLQALTRRSSTRDAAGQILPEVWAEADRAVRVQGDRVVLSLPSPCGYLLPLMAARSPLIVSKAWATKIGDWDGAEATWRRYNNPKTEDSAMHLTASGTGPFKLDRWDKTQRQVLLARNDDYWRAPARLKAAVLKATPPFLTSKMMLQAGDADAFAADITDESKLRGAPGIRLRDAQPDLGTSFDFFFTFQISTSANRFIGSGRLDGEGIPPDFFADKDVRKGFAHAFDNQAFLKDVLQGRGVPARGCIVAGLPDHDDAIPVYAFDLRKAEERLRKAWGGRLWETGFKFTIVTTIDPSRQAVANILKKGIESLNPKFQISIQILDWPSFVDVYRNSKAPIFISGFSGKFPDAHTFTFNFLHSNGLFPLAQRFAVPEMDRLVDAGFSELDLKKRRAIYRKLQELEFEEAPHFRTVDARKFRVEGERVHGWVDSTIFPGAPYSAYLYPIWKE